MNDGIGLFEDQRAQGAHVIGAGVINRDALLAAVEAEEGRGDIPPERRPPAAGIVAALRVLDLDDARAELDQDEAGIGGRHAVPEFDYGEPVQRLPWRNVLRRDVCGLGHARRSRLVSGGVKKTFHRISGFTR